MIILGLNMGHDGAACVIVNGHLKVALTRERISRKKKDFGVDLNLIRAVLHQAGVTLAEVQYVTFGVYKHGPSEVRLRDPRTNRVVEYDISILRPGEYIREYLCEIDGRTIPAIFVHHQLSHCASAFYTSPFENAACLSMDSSLENPGLCSLYAIGRGLELQPVYCPELMIGNAYYKFTEYLGLGDGLFKAGSTMGLAAYGRATRHFLHEDFLEPFSKRRISSDEDFINWMWSQITGMLPRSKMTAIDQNAMDAAATLQMVFEEVLLKAAQRLCLELPKLHYENLCLSGGSFLNCNANTRIARESGFKNVHLFPGCGDDGTAVGSALFFAHNVLRESRATYEPKDLSYLGPDHGATLDLNLGGQALDLEFVADAIAAGKVVGWFHGRSEFGPRALGNRSILADPRSPTMRDYLNAQVKNREWFRPFAPSVLLEDVSKWFEWDRPSPFMLHTAKVIEPEKIPAVSHVDGTARMQTMSMKDNPQYYKLISLFKQKTGVPMVLNTSFNLGGEPVVESPEDALSVFHRSKIDLLVVEEKMFLK